MSPMTLVSSFVALLKKLFAPFPHLPTGALRPFVPFLCWYVFLRGLFKLLDGLHLISWGFHYGSLPRMFVSFLNIHPIFFLIGGVATIVAAILYWQAFPALAEPARRRQGWQQWTTAAVLTMFINLYKAIFMGQSFVWLIISALVGWYLILEFGRMIAPSTSVPRKSARR